MKRSFALMYLVIGAVLLAGLWGCACRRTGGVAATNGCPPAEAVTEPEQLGVPSLAVTGYRPDVHSLHTEPHNLATPHDAAVPATPAVEAVAARPATPSVEPGQYVVSQVYPCQNCGQLQLDKTMPRQAEASKALTYSIRLTNLTSATLSNIVVTEELPEDFELTSATPTAKHEDTKLIWQLEPLGPRAVVEITISGVPTRMDKLSYCTSVAMPQPVACGIIDVVQPRLQLVRTAPQGVLVCDPIEVRYVLSNTGTATADEVKIVESLPEGLQTAAGKSEVVLPAGPIEPGQRKEFVAELKALRTGEYVSTATATSADGLQVESEPATIVVDQPALTITQTGPEKQYVGRATTYEITVTNQSKAPAKDAVIENLIPNGVTSMRATAGATLSGRKIIWRLGTLPPTESKKVYVSFVPTRAGTLTNKATAKAHCADPVSASADTLVAAIPAVLMEVIDVEDPVQVGGRTTYVITVTNQGSAPSTNISVVCSLEENLKYVSSSGATTGTIQNGTLTFAPLRTLPPKGKATWRVVATALSAGDTRFKATMNTDELGRPVEETEATRIYD